MEVADLLKERKTTHGDFGTNAMISQKLKRLFREQPGYEMLNDVKRESLDMIALKLSRILSGQSDFKDHWADASGYSRLAENDCP